MTQVNPEERAQVYAWDQAQDKLGTRTIIFTLVMLSLVLLEVLVIPLLHLPHHLGFWSAVVVSVAVGTGIWVFYWNPAIKERDAAFNVWAKENYGVTFGSGQIDTLLSKNESIVTVNGTRWAYTGNRFAYEFPRGIAEAPRLIPVK